MPGVILQMAETLKPAVARIPGVILFALIFLHIALLVNQLEVTASNLVGSVGKTWTWKKICFVKIMLLQQVAINISTIAGDCI